MTAPPGLGPEERRTLLAVAREAIAAHLAGRRPELPAASGGLAAPGGAFVSLHRRSDGELRGCVGQLQPAAPLAETIAHVAVAAATEDDRFPPVSADELGGLSIEISALSPFAPIRPDEIELGRHGLLVRSGDRRGVLLPRVPIDHGWDREAFLGQTCRKAGLAADAWRRPGVELSGFTATVFAEATGPPASP